MSEEKKAKDYWDKADIVLRPVNGLLTALAVGLLGYYTSSIVREQQTADSSQMVYTQLMSSREQADSSLRKDMFLSVVQAFMQPSGATLDDKLLNIEMLAYNFHESLNLKPLFAEMERLIEKSPSNKLAMAPRLDRVAREVGTRQLVLLTQVGLKFDRSVDFEKLKESPGGIELEPAKLKLNNTEREFLLSVLGVDIERKELTIEMGVRTSDDPAGMQLRKFHVGYYDFPMIDNTRLSRDQRAAVVLNQFGESGADLSLVYFPGSYASLKEKISYDEVVEQLRVLGETSK